MIQRAIQPKERFRVLTDRFFIAPRGAGADIGRVIGLVASGLYSVRIFPNGVGAGDGAGSERLVATSDMRNWTIFETEEEMRTTLSK